MVEIAELLPLIGLMVTGGAVPIIVKKMDLGKAVKDKMQEKLEQIDERLRKIEIDVATLKRNNHQK